MEVRGRAEGHRDGLALHVLRRGDRIVDDQRLGVVDVVVDVDDLQVHAPAVAGRRRRGAVQRDVDGARGHGIDHLGARGELVEFDALAAEPLLLERLHLRLPRPINQLIADIDIGRLGNASAERERGRQAGNGEFHSFNHCSLLGWFWSVSSQYFVGASIPSMPFFDRFPPLISFNPLFTRVRQRTP